MRFDSFLSFPRWEILKILAKKPSSPIELAENLHTTVAYMSQQLKLLDAANLITKKKTGASEKGQPRSLFQLSNDVVYFVPLTKNFTEKKLIVSTDHHTRILKIWMIEDSSLHYYFEKLYWKIEEDKSEVDAIFLDVSYPRLVIVSDSKKLKAKIDSYLLTFQKKVECLFFSKHQLKKYSGDLIPIYDPSYLEVDLKGGTIKDVEK